MADQTTPPTSASPDAAEKSNSARVYMMGLATTVVGVVVWGLLRGFTGIFDVLNLRVFVGVVIVALPFLAVMFTSKESANKIYKLLQSACGLATVLGGEYLGAVLSGKEVEWQKFNLIILGVAVVLPWLNTKKTS